MYPTIRAFCRVLQRNFASSVLCKEMQQYLHQHIVICNCSHLDTYSIKIFHLPHLHSANFWHGANLCKGNWQMVPTFPDVPFEQLCFCTCNGFYSHLRIHIDRIIEQNCHNHNQQIYFDVFEYKGLLRRVGWHIQRNGCYAPHLPPMTHEFGGLLTFVH